MLEVGVSCIAWAFFHAKIETPNHRIAIPSMMYFNGNPFSADHCSGFSRYTNMRTENASEENNP
jgi:hypothetical protein